MHNFKINWLNLIPLSLAMLPQARAAEAVAPEQWLLEQVRIGEAGNKDDLVRQSLYRLELMDPNNPDVIAARMRLALRQGNMALAQQQLDKLKTLAPQSSAYRQAQMNMLLTQPETRQRLQQARLMATAGRRRPRRSTMRCSTASRRRSSWQWSTGGWWRVCRGRRRKR